MKFSCATSMMWMSRSRLVLKYPEPVVNGERRDVLFDIPPPSAPAIAVTLQPLCLALKARLHARLTGDVTMTCHPHSGRAGQD